MKIFRALLTLSLALVFSLSAYAAEVINDFDVLVEVQENGDFVVTETIEVHAEGHQIRRGIFRDIPRYQLLDGKYKIPQRISVMSVNRDGSRSPYMTSDQGNALQIRIGEESVFLDPGAYAYEIKYHMPNQVRYFDDHDEVYWNATGTYWAFPIEKAAAIVRLPPGAVIQDQSAYTGRKGSTEQSYRYQASGNDHIFTAARPLAPREGMTVSLSFDKGLIDLPSTSEKRFFWWVRNGGLILLSLALAGITIFYYRAWSRVGRDPAKGPVFARYAAPQDYSAAALSHIHYKGVRGHKPLIATIMGLAIKGYLTVNVQKKQTLIVPTPPPKDAAPMNPEEHYLYSRLFPSSRSAKIKLNKKPNSRFHGATTKFHTRVNKLYGKDYHRWNIGYILGGVALSVLALIAAITQFYGFFKPIYLFLIIGLLALNTLFMFLMPAPTQKGQDLGTEIDGFRLYMKSAEKMRLDAYEVGGDRPPPMTTDRYEAFLPYAIALGVEEPWSDHFEAAMPEAAKTYNPTWSSGHFNSGRSLSRMTNSMVSNLSSGASSAAPQSSGSSGGGGGGSSGGGGGGGGGGGW